MGEWVTKSHPPAYLLGPRPSEHATAEEKEEFHVPQPPEGPTPAYLLDSTTTEEDWWIPLRRAGESCGRPGCSRATRG